MVIGCFFGKDISTALYSSPQNAQGMRCMTEARWLYCEANGLAGGYTNTDMEYNGSDRMVKVLNFVGLSTELVTGSNVTLEKIKQAIDQKCLVICHVSPKEYYNCSVTSHWALAYSYDATSVVIHDPGYHSIQYKHITNSQFVSALENAGGGNDEILIIVSNPNNLAVGHWSNGILQPQIMACYTQFRSIVGEPYSNGGGVYVHDWHSQDESAHVVIQDFKDNTTGLCYAIIYNPELQQAFLLKGGFRYYYMTSVDGIKELGEPTSNEYPYSYYPYRNGAFETSQPMVTYVRQDFAFDTSLMWRQGNEIVVMAGAGGGGDFHLAIVPGQNGVLTLRGWSLGETSIYLTVNDIGAAHYDVWQGSNWLGEMTNFELTATGLNPETAYAFKVVASTVDETVITESNLLTLTTNSTPPLPVGNLGLALSAAATEIEAIWNVAPAAIHYDVYVNDSLNRSCSAEETRCIIGNIVSGQVYRITVKAVARDGTVLAQDSKSVDTDQNIWFVPTNYPAILEPNGDYAVDFDVINNTDNPVYGFTYRIVQTNSDWLVLESATFADPGSFPPRSRGRLCTVRFRTGNSFPAATQAGVFVYSQFDCNFSRSRHIDRSIDCLMPIVPFVDLAAAFPIPLAEVTDGQPAIAKIQVQNNSNSICPSSRLEAYLNDALAVSVIVPGLKAGEVWEQEFDFGVLPLGQYELCAVADPLNEISESRKDNNAAVNTFVVCPPKPMIKLTSLPDYRRQLGSQEVKGTVENADPAQCRVMVYIQFASVWYPKPDIDALSEINPDGTWQVLLITHVNDWQAAKIRAYLLPQGVNLPNCWPEVCLEIPDIPQALAMVEVVVAENDLPVTNDPVSPPIDPPVIPPVDSPVTDAAINFTSLPVYGDANSGSQVHGTTSGVNPAGYEVWVLILGQDNVYYPKPSTGIKAAINPDGTWSQLIVTDPNDIYARKVLAYLIPKGTIVPACWPEPCLTQPLVPQALAVASSPLAVVTLPIDPPNQPSTALPLIEFTSMPVYGDAQSSGILQGKVSGVDPPKHKVMVYVKVAGVWYPKPNVDVACAIAADGSFSCQVVTAPSDVYATEIKTFLLPQVTDPPDCWPEVCLEIPAIPDALTAVSAVRN